MIESEESDEKLSPDEEVKQLPVSELAITEEERETDDDVDSVEREKKEAQENGKEESKVNDVEVIQQDEELRKSAKEKLNKYACKENKDDPNDSKDVGPAKPKANCKPFTSTLYGPRREKTCLRGFANNKGADQPVHSHRLVSIFIICFAESMISKFATREISIFLLVSVAGETGLSLALSETPEDRFCRDEAHILV